MKDFSSESTLLIKDGSLSLSDILVSELLGSFSDNELSPECLDGAQKFLKPDGVSIPCEYTSFVAPLQVPIVTVGSSVILLFCPSKDG